jgi:hypothetical protein
MCIFGNVSEIVTAFAAAFTAYIACGALKTAKEQIEASNRSQRESSAADIYSGYLKLAIENPKESRRDKQANDVPIDSPKYDAFVTYLLYSAEEILLLYPQDEEWRNALKLDLRHHRDYYNSPAYKDDANSYIQELREIIEEIVQNKDEEGT